MKIYFDEKYRIRKLSPREGVYQMTFDELNKDAWVTLINFMTLNDSETMYSEKYEYDEQGNILSYEALNSEGINSSIVNYTYSDYGEVNSYNFQNNDSNFDQAIYFYRDDNTLERMEAVFDYGEDKLGEMLISYTNEEAYDEIITNYNNGSKTIESYEADQIIKQNFRAGEVLKEVQKYRINEGQYFLEVYEYYNEEGNLEYTEYYDEDGNMTETIYE